MYCIKEYQLPDFSNSYTQIRPARSRGSFATKNRPGLDPGLLKNKLEPELLLHETAGNLPAAIADGQNIYSGFQPLHREVPDVSTGITHNFFTAPDRLA